jgi:hypothetical protein
MIFFVVQSRPYCKHSPPARFALNEDGMSCRAQVAKSRAPLTPLTRFAVYRFDLEQPPLIALMAIDRQQPPTATGGSLLVTSSPGSNPKQSLNPMRETERRRQRGRRRSVRRIIRNPRPRYRNEDAASDGQHAAEAQPLCR